MNYNVKYLFIISLLLSALNSNANDQLSMYKITLIDNIPQSEINDIHQDSQGFIWLATLDGLYRYDGYDYKYYQSDHKKNSIGSNMILNICEDSHNNLWLGTYGRGLSKLDTRTNTFTNYSLATLAHQLISGDIIALEIDKNNNIWIGNHHGIIRVKLDSDFNVSYTQFFPISEENRKKKNFIATLHEDTQGYIWIGNNNTVERIVDIKNDKLITEKYFIQCTCLTGDKDGIIVGGKSIYNIPYDSQTHTYQRPVIISKESATSILKRKNEIWLGSRQGIKRITQDEKKIWQKTLTLHKDNLPFKFNSNVITCLMNNSSEQIWVGTRGGGAFHISTKRKMFHNHIPSAQGGKLASNLTRSIFEDSKKNLWIGDEEEGVFFLKSGHKYDDEYHNISVNTNENNRAYTFEETFHSTRNKEKKSIIWIGTCYPTCLTAVDPETLKTIPLNNKIVANIGFVFTLKKTDENTLWAGTYNEGLWRLLLNNKGEIIDGKQFLTSNSNLSSNIIRSIFQDKKGTLWIGTDAGINKLAPAELHKNTLTFSHDIDPAIHLDLSDYYILEITQSKTNQILFGTMGSGLIVYDPIYKKASIITTKCGLGNNSVKTILEDTETNKLWLSTNRGLSQYNLENGHIINYRKESGLLESEFSEICGVRRKDSTLIFGNRNGFVTFIPKEIKQNMTVPKVFLTKMYINNQLIEVNSEQNKKHILQTSIEYVKEISLKYEERNFSFEFAGLQYDAPQEIQYAYKLEGFDKEWNHIQANQRKVTYTNLPEGDYIFKVKAANGDGIWADHSTELFISIAPPFSRSYTAYILYTLALICVAYLIYIFLSILYKRKKELYTVQLEKQKAEEITQYRFQFFTNISHEFRTPLTLINIPLETLMEKALKQKNEELRKDLSIIKQNTNVLMKLIDQLLDFRKIECGKEVLNTQAIYINDYLKLFYNQFIQLALKQNIDFKFIPTPENLIIEIDDRLFEKVIFNILSNAFKYTPSGQQIIMGTTYENEKVKIYVKDTGNGIALNELPYVFNRYYQGKEDNYLKQEGSGIGLALCKNIIELHHGEIIIDSEQHKGTICSIILNKSTTIPHKNDYKIRNNTDSLISTHAAEPDKNPEQFTEDTANTNSQDGRSAPTILIVEDNDELRKLLYNKLKYEFEIATAKNGQEGLDICIEKSPQLIVTDIKMPIINGIEMCARIKGNEEISHIPVIVLTANNTIQNHLDSFNIGNADAYIEKPFSIDILKSQIYAILKNRELLKEKFRKDSIINPEDIAHTDTDLRFITEIIKIIKKNMSDSELSIEMIAQEYGVSRTYLNRKIKALTGETSNQFLRNIRLKYAAKLILQKKLNINEVAREIGYNDINTFRIRFKEKFGVAPTLYKNVNDENLELS